MPNLPPDPLCKAILICQQTIVEEGTGIVSLIGLFDAFVVREGERTGPAELFCRIKEAQGKYKLTVEVQDLSSGVAIAGAEGPEIELNSPLETSNVIIPVPPLPLVPGNYDLVMFANGAEIDRQKFSVLKVEERLHP